VRYELKTLFRNGTAYVILIPIDFIANWDEGAVARLRVFFKKGG